MKKFLSFLSSRRFLRSAFPATVILFVCANFFIAMQRDKLTGNRQENLLVGTQPTPDNATHPTQHSEVRMDASYGEALADYWQPLFGVERKPYAIVAGMSQMYAINEQQPGDQTISEWMDDFLSPKGLRVLGLAGPNLNNEEATMLLLSSIAESKTKPKAFVFGVCFDKFRNIDLRPGYVNFIKQSAQLKSQWEETAKTYAMQFPQASQKMLETLKSLDATTTAPTASNAATTEKETFESKVRSKVARVLPVVELRKELNVFVQFDILYRLRNFIFNIKPESKRPVLRARYEMNQQFINMMIEIARKNGIQLALYVNPLNPLAETPYVESEYAEFKTWLASLSQQNQVPFADLETAVPAPDWGLRKGQIDFMHFKGVGHKKTAEKLVEAFGQVMLSSSYASETKNDLQ